MRRKHATAEENGEGAPGVDDGRQWIWISSAPACRLILTARVGPRTLEMAKQVIAATAVLVRGIPAFFSDGFTRCLAALIAVDHLTVTFPRTGKRGRPKQPRIEPHADLVPAQLVKKKHHCRLVTLSRRILVGAEHLAERGS